MLTIAGTFPNASGVGGTVTQLAYSKPFLNFFFEITGLNEPLADLAPLINGGGDEFAMLADIFSENDTITGSFVGDFLMGFTGIDTIDSGDGNDTLDGGAGGDTLNGGAGFDTADYTKSLAGVTVNLSLAGPQASSGDANGDVLSGIEQIVGSEFVDFLSGGFSLFGRGGDDQLTGTAGNDNLCGGEGADTLNGGLGFDLARYDYATAGVIVDLAEGIGLAGEALGDTLSGIEGLVGSAHADIMRGDGSNNQLTGLAGADVLAGRGGADTLLGGDGADTLDGGTGNDYLFGGAGADNFTALAADLEANTFDYVFAFEDGADSIVLSGWGPESVFSFESNGHVFITSSLVGFTGGVAVLNVTLAQVQDQVLIV